MSCRRWQTIPLTIYGRDLSTQVFVCRALWYGALRTQPVRIVLVRDPSGRRADEACFCTDLTVDAASILETYARRWSLEVTFHDAKPSLGFEDPQNQTAQAIRQTAPLACVISSLVLLWYASRLRDGRMIRWVRRPWYPAKTTPSFADMLTALRVAGWRCSVSDPPLAHRRPKNSPTPWPDAVLATASWRKSSLAGGDARLAAGRECVCGRGLCLPPVLRTMAANATITEAVA